MPRFIMTSVALLTILLSHSPSNRSLSPSLSHFFHPLRFLPPNAYSLSPLPQSSPSNMSPALLNRSHSHYTSQIPQFISPLYPTNPHSPPRHLPGFVQ